MRLQLLSTNTHLSPVEHFIQLKTLQGIMWIVSETRLFSLNIILTVFVEVKDLKSFQHRLQTAQNRHSVKGEHSLRLFKGWFHQFWKSTERHKHKKPPSQRWTVYCQKLSSDHKSAIRSSTNDDPCPEASQAPHRVECHRQKQVHLVLTQKKINK